MAKSCSEHTNLSSDLLIKREANSFSPFLQPKKLISSSKEILTINLEDLSGLENKVEDHCKDRGNPFLLGSGSTWISQVNDLWSSYEDNYNSNEKKTNFKVTKPLGRLQNTLNVASVDKLIGKNLETDINTAISIDSLLSIESKNKVSQLNTEFPLKPHISNSSPRLENNGRLKSSFVLQKEEETICAWFRQGPVE